MVSGRTREYEARRIRWLGVLQIDLRSRTAMDVAVYPFLVGDDSPSVIARRRDAAALMRR